VSGPEPANGDFSSFLQLASAIGRSADYCSALAVQGLLLTAHNPPLALI